MKGIPDIARHTSVIVTECKDDDNFDYPKGLICASESGELITLITPRNRSLCQARTRAKEIREVR